MRIIKPAFLVKAAHDHPTAKPAIIFWQTAVKAAQWESFADVRATCSSADAVRVSSGRSVVIFNLCGNKFRLITAIHYNRDRLYTLRFLTHAEYSKNRWRNDL